MQLRTRVKICGITREQDAQVAALLGVDAIGLVFYPKSPRHVEIEQAQAICRALPGFVSVVALFMDPEAAFVDAVLAECPIDLIQFHGKETAEFCRGFSRPYIKALGAAGGVQLEQQREVYHDACGLLLDSHAAGEAGGTGQTFDWRSIPPEYRQSIILAGGLKPSNVADAITTVRPYAVDLSSGVESAPGIKDPELMAQLMKQIKQIDCERSE